MFSGELISAENAEFKEQLIEEGWSLTTVFNRFYRFWNQDCSILANYIYIDGDDKKKFAAVSHEYLIKQGYQRRIYLGLMRGPNTLRLALHHPVTELLWFLEEKRVHQIIMIGLILQIEQIIQLIYYIIKQMQMIIY